MGLAAYVLVPTAVYFSLSEEALKEVRRDKGAFDKYLPKWAPKSHIVPGLDLQGGIHMVLGVDVEKALEDKTTRLADRIKDMAAEQKVSVTKTDVIHQEGALSRVRVHFAIASDRKAFDSKVLSRMQELVPVATEENAMVLRLAPQLVDSVRRDSVDQTIKTLRTRIDKMGVSEPVISKSGEDKVQIQLAGYDNAKEARKLLGRTAQLQFLMCDDKSDFLTTLTDLPAGVQLRSHSFGKPDNSGGKDIYLEFPAEKLTEVQKFLEGKIPDGDVIRYSQQGDNVMRTYTLNRKVELTGDDLVDAHVTMGSDNDPRPAVAVAFNSTGSQIFERLTGEHVGDRMAIVLEDNVDSAPVIQVKISGGNASISMGGSRTREEMLRDANQLAMVLKAGALPAPVTFREERSVGASLGADSVEMAKKAFIVGSLLVVAFMIFYYRMAGVFSVIALFVNVLVVLASLAFLGATMTLPGVAGLLLTLGIAVDANVIINERIREELRHGKTAKSAVQSGYSAAFSAVFDAHITTFISGLVLWNFGTGPVQNFATLLLVGTVWSLFTAIVVTRVFFDMVTSRGAQTLSI
jgi:preprotein translocase subunit SecD